MQLNVHTHTATVPSLSSLPPWALLLLSWCIFTSTGTTRLIRDGRMEVVECCFTSIETVVLLLPRDLDFNTAPGLEWRWKERRLHTYRYTVTTRMTSAFRTAMTAFLFSLFSFLLNLCFVDSEVQSHKSVSTNNNLFEEKGQPKRNRAEALLLTNLTPYR